MKKILFAMLTVPMFAIATTEKVLYKYKVFKGDELVASGKTQDLDTLKLMVSGLGSNQADDKAQYKFSVQKVEKNKMLLSSQDDYSKGAP